MSDSWALKELAEKIRKEGTREPNIAPPPVLTGYVAIVVKALDDSLEMIGRTGTEVLQQIFFERYGLKRQDVAYRTGTYMSALKDMLGSSGPVIEKYMLREIEEAAGTKANTMEEAVHLLKTQWEGST